MSHDSHLLGNSEEMVLTKQLAEGKHTYYARGLRYASLYYMHACRLFVAGQLAETEVVSPLVGCVAQWWNVGLWSANFSCLAIDLQLTGDHNCARVNHPLQVSQPGQLSLSSFRGR